MKKKMSMNPFILPFIFLLVISVLFPVVNKKTPTPISPEPKNNLPRQQPEASLDGGPQPSEAGVNPAYRSEDGIKPEDLSRQVVVKLASGTDAQAIARSSQAELVRRGPLQFATLAFPADQAQAAIARLKEVPGVLSVQPVKLLKTAAAGVSNVTDTDPLSDKQWGLAVARVSDAWNLGAAGKGIIVAVVDTGVDLNHPDLQENLLAGYNALTGTAGSSVAQDRNGHGTHVAGIIAAGLNGVGITGVAYQAKILPVKALTRTGEGTDDCIADGIVWAADNGARIINLSLGSAEKSEILKEAVQYAADQGCLIVAAAGNKEENANLTAIAYPAADPNVLAVTATDPDDKVAGFSLAGPQAALAAPGVDILSDYWQNASGYATLSGTSMASPFVAGVAALVWSRHPDWSARQVKVDLENSAKDLGAAGRDNAYGFGRVNSDWALKFAENPPAYASPAGIPWSGGIVRAVAGNTQVALTVPPRAFSLNPDSVNTVTLEAAGGVPDLPAGTQAAGDPVKIDWQGNIRQYPGLTLTVAASVFASGSGYLGYVYRWSGSRWILVGGGVNAATLELKISEPGIYRAGYRLADESQRIAGNDRIQTSILSSKLQFPNGSDAVILARADNFPDALAGVPLAFRLHAPILLTGSQSLAPGLAEELKRLSPQRVFLLGGEGAISAAVEQSLRNSYEVRRFGGSNRYATAALIAADLGTVGKAMLVNGYHFPDALSISAVAAGLGIPILLTDQPSLPAETKTCLQQSSVSEVTLIGGQTVIADTIRNEVPAATRIAGNDRYDTAAAILLAYPPQGKKIVLATGQNFPDALTGGVLAAFSQSNLLIVSGSGASAAEIAALKELNGFHIWTLGALGLVPDAVVRQVQAVVQ
jgi:type VII secretion-associated serine protease mycosin